MTQKALLFAAAATFVMAVCVAHPAAAKDRAGETTRVQPASYQGGGLFPDTLGVGDEIYRQETVYTKEYGSIEITFDDDTNLTVGPSSEILIDDYVYSPSSGAGRAAISLARGAMRVISGRLPKDAILVATPVANIGVRGTDFTLDTASFGSVKIWVDEGVVTAAPIQSQTVFEFAAPAYAVCSATTCEQGAAPPKPVAFPATPDHEPSDDFRDGGGGGH